MERCMGCMRPLEEGSTRCAHCGFVPGSKNPANVLQIGTTLSDHYTVGRMVAELGDGIRYLAYDSVFKNAVEIYEFFPGTLCERDENGALKTLGGCEKTFGEYADRFRRYIRTVARTRDLPAVVPLYDIFEENGTVYAVSERLDAFSFDVWLRQNGGRVGWDVLHGMVTPLLSALVSLHAAGACHLGIAPENIVIDTQGRMRLTHFILPDARCACSDLTPSLVAGYSAPEQYAIDGECGAAADVYGVAALLYTALTGDRLAVGSSRTDISDLTVPTDVAVSLPPYVRTALRDALQPDLTRRTGSLEVFSNRLLGNAVVAAAAVVPTEAEVEAARPAKKKRKKKGLSAGAIIGIVAAVIVVFLAAGFATLYFGFPSLFASIFPAAPSAPSDNELSLPPFLSSEVSQETSQEYSEPIVYYAVDDVVGQNYFDKVGKPLTGNMKLELTYLQIDEQPYGTILLQSPAAGESAAEGATVQVVISAGPNEVVMPDVSSWPYQYAEKYLEALGFEVEVRTLPSSAFPYGQVDHTSVGVGATAARGDKVILFVSGGLEISQPESEPLTVPAEPIE